MQLPITFPTKEEALDSFEAGALSSLFLARARAAAERLAALGPVSVDDVRAVCPPPPGVDSRVMGAIFRRGWRKVGYTVSRAESHRRPIALFERAA